MDNNSNWCSSCLCNKLIIENYKFEDSKIVQNCNNELAIIKNRLCYQKDDEPVITILNKKWLVIKWKLLVNHVIKHIKRRCNKWISY